MPDSRSGVHRALVPQPEAGDSLEGYGGPDDRRLGARSTRCHGGLPAASWLTHVAGAEPRGPGLRSGTPFGNRESEVHILGEGVPLDPVDRDSPRGQPTADLPPGLRFPPLPGIHALLRHYQLRELIPGNRLDQPREISSRGSKLEEQCLRRDVDRRRRGSGQDTIVRNAAA